MKRRVLIARQDNLGDVLLSGPAVRAVACSGAEVTMLCGPRGAAAAELLPGVREVIVWRADWIDPEPQPIARSHLDQLADSLAGHAFEEAMILTSFHQSPLPLALLLRIAGVPRIAAISEDYPGSLLDVRDRVEEDLHEVMRALSLADACGYGLGPGDDGRLRIERDSELNAQAADMRPYVVVHPGASVPARAWSARRNGELVGLLAARGRNIVVTGTAQERELTAAVCGEADPRRVADLAGATSLGELAEVIAAADAIVVGNTGPAHLAAAVGTPTVSIYAPTVPAVRWHPWCVPFELLYEEVPCAGCRARECPVSGHPCVDDVSAESAAEAVLRLTQRRAPLRLVHGALSEPANRASAGRARSAGGSARRPLGVFPSGERSA